MKVNKKEFMKMVENMPDEIEVYTTDESLYGVMNVVVFLEKKDQEFKDWFFGV